MSLSSLESLDSSISFSLPPLEAHEEAYSILPALVDRFPELIQEEGVEYCGWMRNPCPKCIEKLKKASFPSLSETPVEIFFSLVKESKIGEKREDSVLQKLIEGESFDEMELETLSPKDKSLALAFLVENNGSIESIERLINPDCSDAIDLDQHHLFHAIHHAFEYEKRELFKLLFRQLMKMDSIDPEFKESYNIAWRSGFHFKIDDLIEEFLRLDLSLLTVETKIFCLDSAIRQFDLPLFKKLLEQEAFKEVIKDKEIRKTQIKEDSIFCRLFGDVVDSQSLDFLDLFFDLITNLSAKEKLKTLDIIYDKIHHESPHLMESKIVIKIVQLSRKSLEKKSLFFGPHEDWERREFYDEDIKMKRGFALLRSVEKKNIQVTRELLKDGFVSPELFDEAFNKSFNRTRLLIYFITSKQLWNQRSVLSYSNSLIISAGLIILLPMISLPYDPNPLFKLGIFVLLFHLFQDWIAISKLMRL